MIQKIFFFLFLVFSVFGMDIDVATLKKIIQENPQAVQERLILAKYYTQKQQEKNATTLLEEVLYIDKNNLQAQKLLQQIKTKQHYQKILKEAGLISPFSKEIAQKRLQTYYDTQNYQFYIQLYEALLFNHIDLEDTFHIKAAYIYLWNGKYSLAKKALSYIKQTNNIDEAKIKADICYYQGDYKCAAKLYEKLYHSSYDLEYAQKLIQSYIYLGENEKAQRLNNFLLRRYPNNKKLQANQEKLSSIKQSYLLQKQKAYKENPNEKTLYAYITTLQSLGNTQQALEVLHQFNQTMPTKQSLLLEAKYLTWQNRSKEALEVLQTKALQSDLEAKLLLGKIYSWNQQFQKAKKYLKTVLEQTKEKTLRYEAQKALAFVYLWEKENQKAKQLFLELQKQNPHDNEVKEALMELNHNYQALLEIYTKKLSQEPSTSNLKRVAELYTLTKNNTKAIEYLKRYIEKNPNDLEATKQLALLLIDAKDYYQGFGYLEYYAAQKQDTKSTLLLAKYYYWNGFSKEALDILDRILKDEPNNQEALHLKAKILKIAPRFTTSNSGATIASYFQDKTKQQLQIADALYFNAHYEAALMYYENYLQTNPTDLQARTRYAYALEYAKWYGKAEGEFALVLWNNNSDEIRYHYAYNLMKNNKLKKAKKEFLALKQAIYKPLTKPLKQFIQNWKKAWESLDYNQYAQFYSKVFTQNQQWAYRKQQIFQKAKYISVGIYDPVYKKLSNGDYEIRFYQEYANGRKTDQGYKTLQLHCDSTEKECYIVEEKWEKGKYKKQPSLEPFIDNALKELERLENSPTLSNISKSSYKHSMKKKSLLLSKNLKNTMTFISLLG